MNCNNKNKNNKNNNNNNNNIFQESLFLIAKSTELFIHHLTRKAMDRSPDKNNVEYRALADFVNGEDTMQFLQVR